MKFVAVSMILLAIHDIKLPPPDFKGKIFEDVIKERRCVRNYSSSPITLKEISQLLFSAQGITEKGSGLRTLHLQEITPF